jgi:transcriptional regulator with XRE-family HTH domain
MTTLVERIEFKLRELSFSAAEASVRAGLGRTYVRDILDGTVNSPKAANLAKLAEVLGTTPEWLLEGRGEDERAVIPLKSYVGAGAQVIPHDDQSNLDYVEPPPGATNVTAAAIVRGSSQLPAFKEGDIVFWGDGSPDASAFYGLECVVSLRDGRTMVKTVMPGTKPGFYTLSSYNEGSIFDVEITSAAPILWVKRSQSRFR